MVNIAHIWPFMKRPQRGVACLRPPYGKRSAMASGSESTRYPGQRWFKPISQLTSAIMTTELEPPQPTIGSPRHNCKQCQQGSVDVSLPGQQLNRLFFWGDARWRGVDREIRNLQQNQRANSNQDEHFRISPDVQDARNPTRCD